MTHTPSLMRQPDKHTRAGWIGSLVIHALILLYLAWVWGMEISRQLAQQNASIATAPKVELLFPDQVAPFLLTPKKEQRAYIRTSQNEAEESAPADAPFISDRNTRAASKLPPLAQATLAMPTTRGDAPVKGNLAQRDYQEGQIRNDTRPPDTATPLDLRLPAAPSIPKPESQPPTPQPKPKTQPKTRPQNTVSNTPSIKPPLPKPQVRIPVESPPAPPPRPASPQSLIRAPGEAAPDAFTPFTRKANVDGSISREGEDAVDAAATPYGKYHSKATAAISQKWYLYVQLAKDSVNYGRVRFRFYLDRKGKPQDLQILSDARDADPRMRELTLRAILDAAIPPIPPELLPELENGRLKMEYEAIVY
jgi:outer membrane biosynthesis protein TonB